MGSVCGTYETGMLLGQGFLRVLRVSPTVNITHAAMQDVGQKP
jgi:hypothetical protein